MQMLSFLSHNLLKNDNQKRIAGRAPSRGWRSSLAWVFLAVLITQIAAAAEPESLVLTLSPGEGALFVSDLQVLEAADESGLSHNAVPVHLPRHGDITSVAGGVEYSPLPSFWSLGSDSFTYGVDSPGGAVLQRVFIFAALHGHVQHAEDFEGSSLALTPEASFSPAVSQGAAIRGDWGLATTLDAFSQGPLFFSNTDQGDGTPDSGGDCVRIIPPTQQGETLPVGSSLRLFGVGRMASGAAVSVDLLDFDPMVLSATLVDRFGTHYTTGPISASGAAAERQVQLDWWLAKGDSSGGLMLWVDGDVVAELPGAGSPLTIDNSGFDMSDVDLVEPFGPIVGSHILFFDDFEVRAEISPPTERITGRQAFDPIFQDSFQDGDLGRWANFAATSTQTLQDQQLAGNRRLAVDFQQPYPRFVVDNSPESETDYAARFRVYTEELVMGVGEDVMIFAASNGEDADNQQIHAQIWLRRLANGFQVRTSHKPPGQPRINTPWQDLPKAEHVLTLEWLAATRSGAANGRLRLWLDGDIAGELAGLQNGDLRVESVRLGAKNVDPLTSGILYLDDFESWRPAPAPFGG